MINRYTLGVIAALAKPGAWARAAGAVTAAKTAPTLMATAAVVVAAATTAVVAAAAVTPGMEAFTAFHAVAAAAGRPTSS